MCGEEGATGDRAGWLREFWAASRTRAFFLSQLALVHRWGHVYEARVVKGLWGIRSR